jgi:uncharacterized protein YcfL
MKTFVLCAVTVCLLAGCASSKDIATKEEAADMPEYTTGSIIAQKSKSKKTDVQTLPTEKLGEIQQNSSIPIR